MFKPRILLFLVLPFLLVSAEEKPCTTHADGKFYDLTPLKTSKDQKLKTFGGRDISLNICQTAKTETYGLKDDIKQEEVAAFIHGDHGSFVLGKVNTTLDVYDSSPRILISHGSKCKSDSGEVSNTRASALIKFTCDTTVIGSGKPKLEAQLPSTDDESACAFVFEWRTPHACPARETGFLWNLFTFLIVSILILLMTYTILGTLYNRYILNLRGYDQIPQFSLNSMRYHASEVWDWTKDMLASYNIHIPTSRGGGGGGREVNPVSHQAGVGGFRLGEDEEERVEGLGMGLGGGGFVRPSHAARQQQQRGANMNPVSHQSHVGEELRAAAAAASLSQPTTSNAPAPPPKSSSSSTSSLPSQSQQAPPLAQPQPQSALSTRAFALGDDEDGEELADVSSSSKPRPASPSESDSESEEESDEESGSDAETAHLTGNQSHGSGGGGQGSGAGGNQAAAMRGRELGGGGVIRL